jgi:hypothetical protein
MVLMVTSPYATVSQNSAADGGMYARSASGWITVMCINNVNIDEYCVLGCVGM